MTTRDKCKLLRAALENVLTDLGRKLDMKIVVGNSIRFTDAEITVKLVASLPSATTGEIESVEARAFKANAYRYGLQPTDLGREFTHAGDTFTITGAKPKAGKFPILATRRDGKVYKFPADLISGKMTAKSTEPGRLNLTLV